LAPRKSRHNIVADCDSDCAAVYTHYVGTNIDFRRAVSLAERGPMAGYDTSFAHALACIRAGQMAVVALGSAQHRCEGELVMAAEKVSPEHVAFMVRWARGIVSVALDEERMRKFAIPLLPAKGSDPYADIIGASVEARNGVTTGISAADRARTIQTLAAETSGLQDLIMPGHVPPLLALTGGVMAKSGRAEAALDLVKLAGMRPCAALCAILGPDGEAARGQELQIFAESHGLPLVSVRDIIAYRLTHEMLVQRVKQAPFPTVAGELRAIVYRNSVDGREHLALIHGEVGGGRPALVRLHSECLTGDVFGSLRCDCGAQLEQALAAILASRAGVIIYLHQEGRGIGLGNKLRAYALQDRGLDTVQANLELGFADDLRDYGIGAQILRDLEVGQVRLFTNNPRKVAGLRSYGINVVRVPLEAEPRPHNIRYLRAKKEKLGHLLSRLESFDTR
jgi:3,4-dihydroxy 2-butanone 4-phosphate synthase/GTP cyclohydrolase II